MNVAIFAYLLKNYSVFFLNRLEIDLLFLKCSKALARSLNWLERCPVHQKRCRFDSHSGHIARLQVWYPMGCVWVATDWCFALSQISKFILGWGFQKKDINWLCQNKKTFVLLKNYHQECKKTPTEWEKLFANHTSAKELVSRTHNELLQLNTRKTNIPIKKQIRDLNRHFSKEIKLANQHVKWCSH